jgi:hypothetical protein
MEIEGAMLVHYFFIIYKSIFFSYSLLSQEPDIMANIMYDDIAKMQIKI